MVEKFVNYDYVPKEKEQNLKLYKYSAEDHSLLYNHFFSPIAAWSVEYTPAWLAPNLLTLGGLFFVVMPYLVLAYYSPYELDAIVPSWVYWFIFISHFTYFHLDNMDGKQARKYGNSSALGLIFDHGCDAISVYMQATTIINSLHVPRGLWSLVVVFVPAITFFVTNLEEYYTHKMYLPIINPAIEGVVITGVFILLTAILGQEYISSTKINLPILGENTFGQCMCWIVIIGALVSIPMVFLRIKQKVGLGQMLQSIRKCWFMAYCHGIILYWTVVSDISEQYLRYAIMLLGFNMCKQLTIMLLASAGKYKFDSWSPINFFIMTSFLVNTWRAANGYSHTNQVEYLLLCLGMSFVAYIHLVLNVAKQLCRVLEIKCFSVKPQPQIENKKKN